MTNAVLDLQPVEAIDDAEADRRAWFAKAIGACLGILVGAGAVYIPVRLIAARLRVLNQLTARHMYEANRQQHSQAQSGRSAATTPGVGNECWIGS